MRSTSSRKCSLLLELQGFLHCAHNIYALIRDLTTDLKARNIQICLCNPNITVMTKLIDSGLAGEIGEKYIFVSTQDAVQSCLMEIESISDEESPSLHEE